MNNENHYLVKVKANQPKLLASIRQAVQKSSPLDVFVEEQTTRGRMEIRSTYLFEKEGLPEGWDSVARVIYLKREFLSEKKYHSTDSFYITDLESNDAPYIAGGIRSHWGIENKLHYTKDVIMREDKEGTKNKTAAANLALFRDFAFNILKAQNKSIKYATECFANHNVKDLIAILMRT